MARALRSGIALILSTSVACSGMKCGSSKTATAVSTGVPIDAKLEVPSSTAPEPTDLSKSLESALARYSDADFQPDAKAKALGPDVAKIFAFVRDDIRFEAYSGVLRGAYGTLTSRAGNSLDRSLLLATLLTKNGVQTRFASGDLSRDSANTLYARMFDRFVPFVPKVSAGNTFFSRVVTRAKRDYPVIQAAVGPIGGGAAAKARDQALADIGRHMWVQAQVNGQWQDLDSSFQDAVPGKTYCAVKQTVDRVPDASYQKVRIRITTEQVEAGKVSTSEAFSFTAPAAELLDEVVFVTHVPAKQGGGLGVGVGAAGVSADEWMPAVIVGGKTHAGKSINFGDAGGTGLLDAFGGGGDSPQFVAEWIEFEVTRPDGRRDVTRRALVDRASASWRASGSHDADALRPLDRDDEGLLAVRALHNVFFTGGGHDLAWYARVIATIGSRDEAAPNASVGARLLPLAALNFAAMIWSDQLIVPAANDNPSVRLYADSPRIVIISNAPTKDDSIEQTYDLRRDYLFGVAKSADADAAVADRKLWFAALEGALEHESVARDAAAADEDPTAVLSTSSLLGPDGVVALRQGDTARLGTLTEDGDRAARLKASLESGRVVIVPKSALQTGPFGYWEVSDDGNTRAVAGADLNMASRVVRAGKGNVNMPRPPPASTKTIFIPDDTLKSGSSQADTGRASTEYLGMVIVAVDLIGAVSLYAKIKHDRARNEANLLAALEEIERERNSR